MRLCK